MVANESHSGDETENEHFIGILPERRKKLERITRRPVMGWAEKIFGDNLGTKDTGAA